MSDGAEKPIGYASRTPTKAEQNYSQLEKEGLSSVFGIKRIHDYLFGRSFELVTDNKPLLGLLKENHFVPVQAAPCVKRWSLFLSAYEYTLVFRDSKAHANTNALNTLSLAVESATTETLPELCVIGRSLEGLTSDSKGHYSLDRKGSIAVLCVAVCEARLAKQVRFRS